MISAYCTNMIITTDHIAPVRPFIGEKSQTPTSPTTFVLQFSKIAFRRWTFIQTPLLWRYVRSDRSKVRCTRAVCKSQCEKVWSTPTATHTIVGCMQLIDLTYFSGSGGAETLAFHRPNSITMALISNNERKSWNFLTFDNNTDTVQFIILSGHQSICPLTHFRPKAIKCRFKQLTPVSLFSVV